MGRKFDYTTFRAEFVAKLKAREAQEQEQRYLATLSTNERIEYKAQKRIQTHYQRMRVLVYASAEKPDGWQRFDDGYGNVDTAKVERQAKRDWWQYPDYWHYGAPRLASLVVTVGPDKIYLHGQNLRPLEMEAVRNVRISANAEEVARQWERKRRRHNKRVRNLTIDCLREVYAEDRTVAQIKIVEGKREVDKAA